MRMTNHTHLSCGVFLACVVELFTDSHKCLLCLFCICFHEEPRHSLNKALHRGLGSESNY